jgi:hypothetical protein
MVPSLNLNNKFEIVKFAVIITVISGLVLSGFFIMIAKDSFSAIYIIPGSVIHNSADNTVFYKYGVKSSESGRMDYTLETYINATPIKSKQFSLNKGEMLDEQDKIILPEDIQYPSKISLRLKTVKATEEVHFWIIEK